MTNPEERCWLAVASANHVNVGHNGGFMQVNHGKLPPLKRIRPGDRVVYYSPAHEIRGKDRLRSFTAIGTVREGEPYQAAMGESFVAWRRDVNWLPGQFAPIEPLLPLLALTASKPNWGGVLRFGLVQISRSDWDLIAQAMDSGVITRK